MGYRCALTTRKNAGPPRAPFVSPKATGQSEAAFGEVFEGRNIPRDADGADPRDAVQGVDSKSGADGLVYLAASSASWNRTGRARWMWTKVAPILERNIEALKAKRIKEPRRLYRVIKEMGADQQSSRSPTAPSFEERMVGPDKRGRVPCFVGTRRTRRHCYRCYRRGAGDVVVHEATNAGWSPLTMTSLKKKWSGARFSRPLDAPARGALRGLS